MQTRTMKCSVCEATFERATLPVDGIAPKHLTQYARTGVETPCVGAGQPLMPMR